MYLDCKKSLIFSLVLFTTLLLSLGMTLAATATISWDPNSESDLAGYNVHMGVSSGNYTEVMNVGNDTEFIWLNLESGKTYYFVVTAYDNSGNESIFSNEVNATISTPGDPNPATLVAVVVKGETQIDALFSKALDKASAENSSNYTISNGIQVLGAVLDQNQTTVHLITSTHEKGQSYTLSVSNIKDVSGNDVPAGSTNNYDVPESPDSDTTPPQLTYIGIVDETHLDVIFNEPLEKNSVENKVNYAIDNGIEVLQAQLHESGSIVKLTTSQHQNGVTYTLTVNNIKDLATIPNEIEANSSLSYDFGSSDNSDSTPPELVSAKVNGATQIDLNFSESLTKTSAENKNNYLIDGGIEVMGAILDANLATVHLITSTHENGKEYKVTVNNIKDEAGNAVASNTRLTYTFTSDDGSEDDSGNSGSQVPQSFTLFQNYPNPFNPETEIRFFLDKKRKVELKVYNPLGQLVKTIVSDEMPSGFHSVVWNGTNNKGHQVPSGVYIYSLEIKRNIQAGNFLVDVSLERRVRKMTLVR